MATTLSSASLLHAPPELVAAATRDAERDADALISFLGDLGFRRPGPDEPPVRLPAGLLLGLGAAMRLLIWESNGVHVHREAGIPSAYEVLCDVFRRAAEPVQDGPDPVIASLCVRVFNLAVRHFAWEGQPILGADVLLGEADEDALIDSLAQLCWACRKEGEQRA